MDKGARDIIVGGAAVLIYGFGLYCGGTIATNRADQHCDTAINNAVSMALETRVPITCKDNEIISAVKAMALNGAHVKNYGLLLEINDNGEDVVAHVCPGL